MTPQLQHECTPCLQSSFFRHCQALCSELFEQYKNPDMIPLVSPCIYTIHVTFSWLRSLIQNECTVCLQGLWICSYILSIFISLKIKCPNRRKYKCWLLVNKKCLYSTISCTLRQFSESYNKYMIGNCSLNQRSPKILIHGKL